MKISFKDGKATWEMSTVECAAAIASVRHTLREMQDIPGAEAAESVRTLKEMSADFNAAIEEAKKRADNIMSGS